MNLAQLEGIRPAHVEKLAQAGIKTPLALLKRGYTPALRRQLAEETGISEELLLAWVRFADILQVEGIGVEYAGLLDEIGIDTAEALAVQNARSLAKQLKQTNEAGKRVSRLPSLKQLQKAIRSATKIRNGPHSLTGNPSTVAPPPRKKRIRRKKRRT